MSAGQAAREGCTRGVRAALLRGAVRPSAVRVLAGLLVAAVLVAATPARAEPTPEPSPGEVNVWFERANDHFAAGEYEAALGLLERACARSAFPGCALNLGAVHHALRHCSEARGHYQAYLQQDPSGERAAEARAALDELDAHCPNERAPGAGGESLAANSSERPRLVGPVPELGTDLPVRDGQSAIPPAAPMPPMTIPPAPTPRTAPPPGDAATALLDAPQRYRAVAASVTVMGGVAGLTSMVFGLRLADKNAEIRRNKSSAYDEAQAARLERAREYRALGVGAGVASGVLFGVGGVFWWLGAEADASTSVGVTLDDGAGVRVTGRF